MAFFRGEEGSVKCKNASGTTEAIVSTTGWTLDTSKETLRKKADKSRFTYGQLAQVYRRGQGAYLSSGSRNVPMAAWAMGRVNSFISGKGGARKADADILRKKSKKK